MIQLTDEQRLWRALKYRIQAANDSRSRLVRQQHLDQAALYLNALNNNPAASDILTVEDKDLIIGAIPLQSGLLDSDSQAAGPDYGQLARELALIVDVGTSDDRFAQQIVQLHAAPAPSAATALGHACGCTDHDPNVCLEGKVDEGSRYCHCDCHVGATTPSSTQAIAAAEEIADRWCKDELPEHARAQSTTRAMLRILAEDVLSRHCFPAESEDQKSALPEQK